MSSPLLQLAKKAAAATLDMLALCSKEQHAQSGRVTQGCVSVPTILPAFLGVFFFRMGT